MARSLLEAEAYDPPVGTAYMANQLGVPWAATEVRGNEDIGNNYFGVDLNFNPTTTTGIKLYRPANGWLTWTQGLASQVDRNFGLFRVDLADHYSFRTHD